MLFRCFIFRGRGSLWENDNAVQNILWVIDTAIKVTGNHGKQEFGFLGVGKRPSNIVVVNIIRGVMAVIVNVSEDLVVDESFVKTSDKHWPRASEYCKHPDSGVKDDNNAGDDK